MRKTITVLLCGVFGFLAAATQAADLAGYSKRAFIEVLGKYSVAVFDYPPDELAHEIGD